MLHTLCLYRVALSPGLRELKVSRPERKSLILATASERSLVASTRLSPCWVGSEGLGGMDIRHC